MEGEWGIVSNVGWERDMFGDGLSRMGMGDGGAGDGMPRDGRDGSESLKFSDPLPKLVGVGLSGAGLDAAVLPLDASCKATGNEKKLKLIMKHGGV